MMLGQTISSLASYWHTISIHVSQRRMDLIIGLVIQHVFLIVMHVLNCIPIQVKVAETDVDDCTGSKESFFR